jgi:hypothetical protein
LTDLSGYAKKSNANGDTRSGLRLLLACPTVRRNCMRIAKAPQDVGWNRDPRTGPIGPIKYYSVFSDLRTAHPRFPNMDGYRSWDLTNGTPMAQI